MSEPKFDFEQRQRITDLEADDPEDLATIVVSLEADRDKWKRRAEAAERQLQSANAGRALVHDECIRLRAKLARAVEGLDAAVHMMGSLIIYDEQGNPRGEADADLMRGVDCARSALAVLQDAPQVDEIDRAKRDRLLLRADEALCMAIDIDDPNMSPSERDWIITQARGVHIDITNTLHPDTPQAEPDERA